MTHTDRKLAKPCFLQFGEDVCKCFGTFVHTFFKTAASFSSWKCFLNTFATLSATLEKHMTRALTFWDNNVFPGALQGWERWPDFGFDFPWGHSQTCAKLTFTSHALPLYGSDSGNKHWLPVENIFLIFSSSQVKLWWSFTHFKIQESDSLSFN